MRGGRWLRVRGGDDRAEGVGREAGEGGCDSRFFNEGGCRRGGRWPAFGCGYKGGDRDDGLAPGLLASVRLIPEYLTHDSLVSGSSLSTAARILRRLWPRRWRADRDWPWL